MPMEIADAMNREKGLLTLGGINLGHRVWGLSREALRQDNDHRLQIQLDCVAIKILEGQMRV